MPFEKVEAAADRQVANTIYQEFAQTTGVELVPGIQAPCILTHPV
jgi:hypothetical protein